MDPFIVGLDVGYSNLKVAWGTAHAKPYTHIAPAAGGPVEQLSERLGQDGAAVDGGASVWIGGKPWIVGVEPRRIEPIAPAVRRHCCPGAGTEGPIAGWRVIPVINHASSTATRRERLVV